jgi:hypothetical protein
MTGLAARQAELVRALVAGGRLPAGFDPGRVGAAAAALRRKRAGEVAKAWPLLAAGLGAAYGPRFTAWARDRSAGGQLPAGSFADGFLFARALRDAGTLPELAAAELAEREAEWSFDGVNPARRRGRLARMRGLLRIGNPGGRLATRN